MKVVPKSYRDWGMRTDNFSESLIPYALLTLILVSGLFLILKTFPNFSVSTWISWQKLYPSLLTVVLLSALQELFFRGYLICILKSLSESVVVVVAIDAALFAAMHLVFPHPEILVPAAFLSGAAFATIYYYYPNLILASAVHILLVMAYVPFCFFGLVSC